jgi:hypothetical protein
MALAGFASACSDTPTDAVSQESAAPESEADFSVIFGDLTEGLGLTDDQLSAVNEVMAKYRGESREPGTLWYAAADLQDVLSSDQVAAIEVRRAELRSEMNSRRGRRGTGPRQGSGRRGEGGPHVVTDILDLSEEQLVELKTIRERYAPELEEIRDAVRDGSLTRDEAKIRLEAIREATHEAMLGILTADQVALLEEHMAKGEAMREGARARREGMKDQWEERRQAERAAMVEALGLTAEQVEAIDALKERAGRGERPSQEEMESRRAEHHQALLEILDADQEEIWILHGSLSESLARHRRAAGGSNREGRRPAART